MFMVTYTKSMHKNHKLAAHNQNYYDVSCLVNIGGMHSLECSSSSLFLLVTGFGVYLWYGLNCPKQK